MRFYAFMRWLFLGDHEDLSLFIDDRPVPIALSASLALTVLRGFPRQYAPDRQTQFVVPVCWLVSNDRTGRLDLFAKIVQPRLVPPQILTGLPAFEVFSAYAELAEFPF
jgi:hypothetical protein